MATPAARPSPPLRIASSVSASSSSPAAALSRASPSHAERLLLLLVLAVAAVDVAFYMSDHDPRLRIDGGGNGPLHHLDKRHFIDGGKKTTTKGSGAGVGAVVGDAPGRVRGTKGGPAGALRASFGSGSGSGSNGGADRRPAMNETAWAAHLRELLRHAGVEVDADLESKLPSRSDLASMYGSGPVVVGLDACEEFRDSVPRDQRYVGPAGIFNTGTNLLAELLEKNCRIVQPIPRDRMTNHDRFGMRWQVPWGKHTPASWRGVNVAYADKQRGVFIDPNLVLPVVTIKDPYGWMGSMCRHSYAANWPHKKWHCPNLIPSEKDLASGIKGAGPDGAIPVRVRFNADNVTRHSSLAGLWNDWYGAYHHSSGSPLFPRIVVRFEDLLLYPERVVEDVCRCAGGEMGLEGREKGVEGGFIYVGDSAKGSGGPHTGSSGLVSALLRYGSPEKRVEGFTAEDLEYAERALRGDLMEAYGYSFPPRPQ